MIGLGLAIPSLSTLGNPLNTIYAAVLALFSSGASGTFLDANDWGPTGTGGTGVVFQDLSGTAVTAMEQPVQLILDKSQGLKLGSELVVNGSNLVDTSRWVAQNSTLVAVGGQLQVTNASGALYGSGGQVVSGLTVGKMYKVVVTFTKGTSDGRLDINGVSNVVARSTSGVMTWYFVATGTTAVVSCVNTTLSVGAASSYGPISCKSIAGNHAYVSASANRPVISARYNLYTKTESIKDWATTNCTVDPTPVAAHDGKLVAYRATFAANGLLFQNGIPAAGSTGSFTQTAYVKSATGTNQTIRQFGNGGLAFSSNIVVGNSWIPISFAYAFTAVTSGFTTASGGTADILICYPDIRPTDQATGLIPTYQRVNTATDYDWSPAFPPMIRGNSSNQYLTGNMDLSGTNKVTVWAGVRKIDTTSSRCFVHLSDTVLTNNGAFYIDGPDSGNDYGFDAKGTIENYQATSPYVPPITNTLCMAADIAAPSLKGYVNGVLKVNSSASMGTGNFGNYPYYVLSRAGTGRFQSGGFNTLIILGAAATAAQISTTEAYCNQKLRAY